MTRSWGCWPGKATEHTTSSTRPAKWRRSSSRRPRAWLNAWRMISRSAFDLRRVFNCWQSQAWKGPLRRKVHRSTCHRWVRVTARSLIRLRNRPAASGPQALAEIDVSYADPFAQRTRDIRRQVEASVVPIDNYNSLADIEVRRNATIVRSAEALRVIDRMFGEGRYAEAWQGAHAMEQELRSVAAIAGDSQMVQDADLFQRYQLTLASALGYDPSVEPAEPPSDSSGQPQRWGASPVPFEIVLPTIEVR